MDGLVFRHDDPFWDSHYPPNGFNCRCRVRALDQAEMDEEGLKLTDSRDHLKPVQQEVGMDKRTGEVVKEKAVKFTLGNKSMTPDPGWNYNPGRAGLSQLQAIDISKMQKVLNAGNSGPANIGSAVKQSINQGLASPHFRRFINNTKAADGELWPVAAVLPQRLKDLGLPEQGSVLRLSSGSVDHLDHQKRFAELKNEDWQRVQRMIDRGKRIPDGRESHRILLLWDQGKPWKLVFKHTPNDELFLATYHRLKPKYARKLEKRKGGEE